MKNSFFFVRNEKYQPPSNKIKNSENNFTKDKLKRYFINNFLTDKNYYDE